MQHSTQDDCAPNSSSLSHLRHVLDEVDDMILRLVEQRLSASKAIAACKDIEGPRWLKLNPAREEAVVGRLRSQSTGTPPGLIEEIWRSLMAYGRHAQLPLEILICASRERIAILDSVRKRFGFAAPVRWMNDPVAALCAARSREAIAILETEVPQSRPLDDTVSCFARIDDPHGRPLAYAFGRVGEPTITATPPTVRPLMSQGHASQEKSEARSWSPASWREKPVRQMPDYPDPQLAHRVEARLRASPPLVAVADILHLKAQLANVAYGRSFLLQGGDCAESFAEFGADKVRTTFNLLLRMGAKIESEAGLPVVHLARIAGQFAKPRSSDSETIHGRTLPTYRGDAVNGQEFSEASRTPDPRRLLEAHRQAEVTVHLLSAFAAASYADLRRINSEAGVDATPRPVSTFTSHEALLLNYEQALTRYDKPTESWWATSGHLLWLGDRTRELCGAHVEFARGVANPLGLKCGPSLAADDLLRLIDVLDPDNQPGRLLLIGRFGAQHIEQHLPGLMAATRKSGRKVTWSTDPMHGNTRSASGVKTRFLKDILKEIEAFFAIAQAENVHAGGVHLEMTGADVTECLGGSAQLVEEDLARRYLTHCDPRLNESQAQDVANHLARLLSNGNARCAA